MRRSRRAAVVAIWVWALVGLQCGEDNGPDVDYDLLVSPESVSLEASSTRQFAATLDGQTHEVNWYVDGVIGGTPARGMITPGGLYVAPHDVPAGSFVRVAAKSKTNAGLEGTAKVVVTRDGSTPYVVITPDMATVPVADSVAFVAEGFNCSAGSVSWSYDVVFGAPVDSGVLRSNGVYVAPSLPYFSFRLMVRAQSSTCDGKVGLAQVTVKQPLALTMELETFTESSDTTPAAVSCGSGRYAVQGLDTPGEWILVPVVVPAGGRYQATVTYATPLASVLDVNVAIVSCGGVADTSSDFVLDEGTGVGAG